MKSDKKSVLNALNKHRLELKRNSVNGNRFSVPTEEQEFTDLVDLYGKVNFKSEEDLSLILRSLIDSKHVETKLFDGIKKYKILPLGIEFSIELNKGWLIRNKYFNLKWCVGILVGIATLTVSIIKLLK